jgi:hypothetical protein
LAVTHPRPRLPETCRLHPKSGASRRLASTTKCESCGSTARAGELLAGPMPWSIGVTGTSALTCARCELAAAAGQGATEPVPITTNHKASAITGRPDRTRVMGTEPNRGPLTATVPVTEAGRGPKPNSPIHV